MATPYHQGVAIPEAEYQAIQAQQAELANRYQNAVDPAEKDRIAQDYRALQSRINWAVVSQGQGIQPVPVPQAVSPSARPAPQASLGGLELQMRRLAEDYQRETDDRAREAIAQSYRKAYADFQAEQTRIQDQQSGINTRQSPLSPVQRMRLGATGDDTQEALRMLRAEGMRSQVDDRGRVLVQNPETGAWHYADESGTSWGDIFDLASPAIRGVGGTLGGLLGTMGGPVAAAGGAGAGEMVGGIVADQLLRPEQQATFEDRAMTAGLDFASGAIPEALGPLLKSAFRTFIPGVTPSPGNLGEALANVEAYARQGVTPANVASVNPSFANRAAVAITEPMPLVGGPRVQQRMADTTEQFGQAVERVAPGGSPYETGRALRQGILSERDRLAEEQGAVFNELGRILGTERRAMPTTQRILAETAGITEPIERATRVNPVLERIRPNEGEPLEASFETIQRQRSQIGEMIRNPQLAPQGTDQRRLKEAYRALTRDMEQIARDAGVEQEWKAATRRYRDYANRLKDIDRNFKPETSAPEELAARVSTLARTAPSKLEQLKASVKPEDWNQLASYVLRDIAQGTPGRVGEPGEVSIASFLTGINKLGRGLDADRAKTILFGERGAAMRENVEDLARIASTDRNMRSLLNTSQTARALIGPLTAGAGGTALAGVPGGAGALALGVGAPAGLSFWITRDGFSDVIREAARRADGDSTMFERALRDLLPRLAGQTGTTVAGDVIRPDR